MFDGIAEHEGRKTESCRSRFFLRNCLFFLLFLFNLFLFNVLINVKRCFDVLLFIVLVELALHIVSFLGQFVFYTYTLFWTLKIHYRNGRVFIALDQRWVGSSSLIDDLFFFKARYFLTIFMIFSPS